VRLMVNGYLREVGMMVCVMVYRLEIGEKAENEMSEELDEGDISR